MTRDEFDEWGDYHISLFSFSTEAQVRSVLDWVEIFRASGFTAEELKEASRWLVRHAGHKLFPGQHPQSLNERMVEWRRETAVKPPPEADWNDKLGTCVKCNGAGMLSLPHPKYLDRPGPVRDDPETPHMVGVLCDCALGNYMAQRSTVITLRDYTAKVPDWPERMRLLGEHQAYLRKLREMARSGRPTNDLDAAIARLLAKAANSVQ